MTDEHRGNFLHRRQPAAGDLGEPIAEELPCRAFVAILPNTPQGPFQLPSLPDAEVQVGGLQAENRKVTHPKVIAAFKGLSARAGQFVMLGLAHIVSRFVQISTQIKFTMDDFVPGSTPTCTTTH